ncbi:MAG: aminotransferase class V-fold PLP-dependent enzyme [Rhodoglobus sp.]
MTTIDDFVTRFAEEPGYLDFARVAPVGDTVSNEEQAMMLLLRRSRFGTLSTLEEQDLRLRQAAGRLLGFRPDQLVFQPNTAQALMHLLLGLSGEVAVIADDLPGSLSAAVGAAAALGSITPLWLDTDHGRIMPGTLRDQLTDSTVAVAISLADSRTGYLADLDGIRQVIGDRLLIVDALHGFGIVDAPWAVADVILSGGHTWVRSGWGTGFVALSDRAADRLIPVFSGLAVAQADAVARSDTSPSANGLAVAGISAVGVIDPDPIAQARFAAAMEEIAAVGVAAIAQRLATQTAAVIDLADEFGMEVVSPRDDSERAGIVVVAPGDRLTGLVASLHNHGVTVTAHQASLRISPHVTTDDDTLSMLRSSYEAFRSPLGRAW